MSREDELVAIATPITAFAALEVPTTAKWNQTPTAAAAGLIRIGQFFTEIEDLITEQAVRIDLEHDAAGHHNPPAEWVAEATPTYVDAQNLQLVGDRRADFAVAHRVRVTLGTGGGATVAITAITGVVYVAGQNKTVLTVTPAVLTATLSALERGLVRASLPKVRSTDLMPNAVGAAAIDLGAVDETKLAVGATAPTSGRGGANVSTTPFAASATVETVLASVTVTTRGGPVRVAARVAGYQAGGGALATQGLVLRIRRDPPAGATVVVTDSSAIVAFDEARLVNGASATINLPVNLHPDDVDYAASGGSHTYVLTGRITSAAAAGITLVSGRLTVQEAA